MKICVIPARGGSKRIPRKNIKLFHNKPMIAWSIRAAKKSKIFDKIIVSTDDEEIAAEAEERGVEVPFMRPKEISDDYTNTTDVISHSCEWALKKKLPIEMVCCIYATAPFVRPAIRQHMKSLNLKDGNMYLQLENIPHQFFAPLQKMTVAV